jgi:uncharacterized repeat protein (TIGR01451 family)
MKEVKNVENQIKTKKMLMVMVLLSILVFVTSVSSVSAASTVYVNVTAGNDSNIGTIDHPYQTIQKGIDSVDENGTVYIADGVYNTSKIEIMILKNMNIIGQSQTGTILNGTPGVVFGSDVTITLTNLTLTNGYDVFNQGTLTITNCTFTNNLGLDGGAIYNEGSLTVINSTFTNNTGILLGGAIYNDGIINSVSGCTFTNNTGNIGGDIYNHGFINYACFNWWGSNNGPAFGKIGGHMPVVCSPWLCMNVTVVPSNIVYNGSCNVTVSFNKDSNGNSVSGVCIPDGTVVSFNSLLGTFNSTTAKTQNGIAVVTFIGTTIGTGFINAITDSQTVSTSITVNLAATILTVTNVTGVNGQTVGLTAALKDENGNPLSGKTVTFTVNGNSYTATTDASGIAALSYPISETTGTYTITASFVDGTIYVNSTGNGNLTVDPSANLYINTTTSNQNPTVGDTFILTYKLGNKGPDEATNVTMSFQIPSGLEFVTASVDNGTCTYNPANRTITWTLSNVTVGDPYLYLTVRALRTGSYSITPTITSETFNRNTDPLTPFSINLQAQNNNNNSSTANSATVNAASTTKTVPMQTTGMPIAGLILAILAVVGGMFTPRKK